MTIPMGSVQVSPTYYHPPAVMNAPFFHGVLTAKENNICYMICPLTFSKREDYSHLLKNPSVVAALKAFSENRGLEVVNRPTQVFAIERVEPNPQDSEGVLSKIATTARRLFGQMQTRCTQILSFLEWRNK